MNADKSFIVVLDRMEKQAIENIRKHDPSVDSQHQDGVNLGFLYAVQQMKKAYLEYE